MEVGTPPGREEWAVSYLLADQIVLEMVDGRVEHVLAEGSVSGIQLEPGRAAPGWPAHRRRGRRYRGGPVTEISIQRPEVGEGTAEHDLDDRPTAITKVEGVSRLRADGLTKVYQRRKVVNAVELEVRQGEIVGLLGPNGAGKTTTFYMIVGLISPNKGRVFLDDQDLTRVPMYKRARLGVGYLAQEPSIFRKLTVEENVLAILETRGTAQSAAGSPTRRASQRAVDLTSEKEQSVHAIRRGEKASRDHASTRSRAEVHASG